MMRTQHVKDVSSRLLQTAGSYLVPCTIVHTSSMYNRDIRLQLSDGKFRLLVNGIEQSGPSVHRFWKFAFSQPFAPKHARRILVLGVGGGTVIRLLRKRYKDAAITAVDIDSKIIDIARQYFGVSSMTNVVYREAEAGAFVAKVKKQYDLIVSDLYIGRTIPAVESSDEFIRNLSRIKTNTGHVVINFLHDGTNIRRANKLYTRLSQIFDHVRMADLPYNRFFWIQ